MDILAVFDRAKELAAGGQLDEACALTDRLLSHLPGQPDILLLRAVILERSHRYHDALAITGAILAERPDDIETTALRGQLLIQTGQLAAAAATLERAGLLMLQAGQIGRAEAQWQAALAAAGDQTARSWIDLLLRIRSQATGLCLEPFWQKAIRMPTDDPSVKIFQASAACARGEYTLFLSLYQEALAAGERHPQEDYCYATLLVREEKYREALPVCDRLRGSDYEEEIVPWHALALIQCGVPHQQDINRLLIRWGRTALADRPASLPLPSARRPLRLGFCSFWLGNSSFLVRVIHPLAVAMARQGVEITLYVLGDTLPQFMPALPGCRWVVLNGLDDAAAASAVRADQLHGLITLDLIACWPRAGFYRYRPAPWICSYMHSSVSHGGAVDALLFDSWMKPPCPQDDFVEETVIAPECSQFYPIDPAAPDITPPPVLTTGHITFASCNRPCKIGPETAAAWARLLHALPTARLYLRSRYFDAHETRRIRALFQQADIAPDRVTVEGETDLATFMHSYSRIDIALDTFFNNGGITTAEALWQGIPLIAIPGATVTSRISASILDGIGMQEWIARDEEDWLAKTIALASDTSALSHWRQNLRPRMTASILCDADRAAANLLAAIAPAIDRLYDREN